jgi:hypothetical protein
MYTLAEWSGIPEWTIAREHPTAKKHSTIFTSLQGS